MGEERTRGNSAGDSGRVTTQAAAEGKVRVKSAPAEDFAELTRDLTTQVVKTSSEAAALRARLQLTEQAQSSLEEEARALREERDRLRAELEAKRSKGFWVRLFGG